MSSDLTLRKQECFTKRSNFNLNKVGQVVQSNLLFCVHHWRHIIVTSLLEKSPVESVLSDPKLIFPARSCDTIRANRSPSSISVCWMRWRLQLAGLDVSVWGRGDADWLHCEPMSNSTDRFGYELHLTEDQFKAETKKKHFTIYIRSLYRETHCRSFLQINCHHLPSGSSPPSPQLQEPMRRSQASSPKAHRCQCSAIDPL